MVSGRVERRPLAMHRSVVELLRPLLCLRLLRERSLMVKLTIRFKVQASILHRLPGIRCLLAGLIIVKENKLCLFDGAKKD